MMVMAKICCFAMVVLPIMASANVRVANDNDLVNKDLEKKTELYNRLCRWEREVIPDELLRNQHDRANMAGPTIIRKRHLLERTTNKYK